MREDTERRLVNYMDGCFFFNDTATTEIYTLSLHDALPISEAGAPPGVFNVVQGTGPVGAALIQDDRVAKVSLRSEEHTSELQSRPHISYAVFCLKKKFSFLPHCFSCSVLF